MSAAPAALLLNFRLRRLRRKAASVAVSIGDDIWRTSGGTPKRGGSVISSLPEPVTAELDACFLLFDMEFCEARVQDCRDAVTNVRRLLLPITTPGYSVQVVVLNSFPI
jgi:hypothetical protein